MKYKKIIYIAVFLVVNAAVLGYWVYDIIREPAVAAEIVCDMERVEGKPGALIEVPVTITNRGAIHWPKGGDINISYHIEDLSTGTWIIDGNGARTSITRTLHRGQSLDINLNVLCPDVPGEYRLHIEPVKENHFWFREAGSPVTILPLSVSGNPGGGR